MPSFTQAKPVQGELDMDALTTYKLFAADPKTAHLMVSKKPEVAREVEYYSQNIGSIESIDDLMSNQRIYSFVMKSYGLEDMAYAKAFIRTILEEGSDDASSLANRLSDSRYGELVEDFNFNRYGSTTTTFERVTSGTVDKFYQQQIESDAGKQNNGTRLALYFQRKSDEIESAYSILADQALLKFVQTSFGLPIQMSFQSLEKQAEMINQRLDIEDLADPEFVDRLVNRFLASWDLENPDTVSVPPLILSPGGVQGISQDLLMSLQNLKTFR